MRVSLEISKYPLTDDYIPQVWAFIEHLKSDPALEVHTNALSTQVFGPMSNAFAAVQRACEASFEGEAKAAIVLKILPGDVREL